MKRYPFVVVPYPGELHVGSEGPAVLAVTRALRHAGYMKKPTRHFGAGTKAALERFQKQHKKVGHVTGRYDQQTHHAMLELRHFDAFGAHLMREGVVTPEERMRHNIVSAALFAYAHRPRHYTQDMVGRMEGLTKRIRPPQMWSSADCSGFATWCYWLGTNGKVDPNGHHFKGYPANDFYTGSLARNGREVSTDDAQPADLAIYGDGWPYEHTAVIVTVKPRLTVISHGHEGGPFHELLDYRSDRAQIRSYL